MAILAQCRRCRCNKADENISNNDDKKTLNRLISDLTDEKPETKRNISHFGRVKKQTALFPTKSHQSKIGVKSNNTDESWNEKQKNMTKMVKEHNLIKVDRMKSLGEGDPKHRDKMTKNLLSPEQASHRNFKRVFKSSDNFDDKNFKPKQNSGSIFSRF